MIIDSCIFHNEFAMLEFRMKLLWDCVDYFVVVEADRTHAGKKKSFNLPDPDSSWAKEKLIVFRKNIDISDLNLDTCFPEKYSPDHACWKIENRQRSAIIDACKEFSDDDILMVSDCDEIPSLEAVEFRKAHALQYPMACQQQVSVYGLDYICPIDWRGTVISTLGYARSVGTQKIRDRRNQYSPFTKGGWHLSYFGGAEQVKNKIQSFAHQELNKEEFTDIEYISKCIQSGAGIFPEGTPTMRGNPSFYPKYFLDKIPSWWWIHQQGEGK